MLTSDEHRDDGSLTPGRPADIGLLYEAELPKLVRYIRRKTGSAEDAADLAQDSFLKFLRAAPTIMIRTPEAYLRRIATNLLRDRAERLSTRYEGSALPIEAGWNASDGIDQQRSLESQEDLERVQRALAGLKPLTRRIFWLHRVEGRTYREIQDALALSEGVVKAHMRKAIARTLQVRRSL